MQNSLGNKIRFFRKRAGLSQLDLEMAIGASAGMISRIENGKVNPSKETLINIAYTLKLNTSEIASLFCIDLSRVNDLEPTLLDISSKLNIQQVLDKIVNDLVLKLGYIASAIFLLENDEFVVGGLTASDISAKVFQHLSKPIDELRMSVKDNPTNLLVRAITENESILTFHNREYLSPIVSVEEANAIQESTGDVSTLVCPLITGDIKLGAIVFAKKFKDDFREDQVTLERVLPRVSAALANAVRYEYEVVLANQNDG